MYIFMDVAPLSSPNPLLESTQILTNTPLYLFSFYTRTAYRLLLNASGENYF